ncbi:MAG: phosphoribosylformylglycinamidine synthase subunit PurQ [Chthonomonadaceae bacterium]|nr:phosphoribosylformylglycinamidine synthase subunit PurQ [Chthonomonadaceae bacterium]
MTLTAAPPKEFKINSGAKAKCAVLQFPGSNCDQDALYVLRDVLGHTAEYVWHNTKDVRKYDLIVIPGGFSYGDYLRTGAVARFAPVMDAVRSHAQRGGLVVGICNGFQILCEAQLLPGALMRNTDLKFVCKYVHLRVENNATPFTEMYKAGQVLKIPLAHGEGRYVCDEETLLELNTKNRVLFRYTDAKGKISPGDNPNGSLDAIAGITNADGNVMGMMPHPERACEKMLGSADGRALFESAIRQGLERRG